MSLVSRSAVLFLVVLSGLVGLSTPLFGQVVSSNGIVKDVEFTAEDGVILKGSFFIPTNGQSKHPAVILVHERGGDRLQWASYIGVFHQQGYAVLSYDVRGQGESTRNYQVPVDDLKYQLDLVKDVGGALRWLLGQPEIDAQRLGLIGTGFSANTVWASMGIYPEFKAAVVLSIRFTQVMPTYPLKFTPHGILFMCDPIDLAAATYYGEQTDKPKAIGVYKDGFGLELLQDPRAVQDLFAWLRRHLLSF